MTILLVTALAGLGFALIFYGLYGHVAAAVDTIEQRLGRYAGMNSDELREHVTNKGSSVTIAINKFVDRQSFADRLREDLYRADLQLTPGEFTVMRIAGMGIAALIGFLLWGILPALALAVVVFFSTRFWLKRRCKQRERKFLQQLGDGVMMMASGLRAGYSMMQTLEMVSREMPLPLSDEFHRVTMEVGVGIPIEEALNHLLRRIKSTDLELMVIAMNVQREVGGNLAEILDTIGATIRERQELYGEVRTLTAQGRISAYVITGLPVLVLVAMFFLDRPYVSALWTTTFGYFLSAVALTLLIIGFFVTKRVAEVEV
jgi:tight adherence protein B